ncbi:DUF938 domain-containing protein [Sinobacterium caligoides]|uniref:DUF938 domain-containing protein n=1 Tax=Sinobacterium caligoides TaxID=933926 RepID=UPI001FE4D946|nr:DUF938 domain-containing protein [Sinobacterium caligoides]
MAKAYSAACDNNKAAILAVLQQAFSSATTVLEIGAGTGQHAVFFAPALPHLQWLATEREAVCATTLPWLDEAQCDNLHGPISLDVSATPWPDEALSADALFTANTLHIMSWSSVQQLFRRLAALPRLQRLCIYGPFNYDGEYTSDSNARFDQWLQQRDRHSAIRDVEAVQQLATEAGFHLYADHALPANNRLLEWHRDS